MRAIADDDEDDVVAFLVRMGEIKWSSFERGHRLDSTETCFVAFG